jgi:DNA-binding NtrC family response regulator
MDGFMSTEFFNHVERIARHDCPVLITGETGTGKDVVARTIHRHSPRVAKPLVALNCAALPESLLESELFGHAQGAFTGAVGAYPGKLRLAQGGTVLLDEIAEMAPHAQAKLLRALESHEIFPLGAKQSVRFDVRFIAATHHDVADEGSIHLRRDLFYRLCVAHIHMAPLRDRPEEIAPLVSGFISEFNQRYERTVTGFGPDALDLFMAYSWPGNVRELRNVVEATYVACPSCRFTVDDIPAVHRRRLLGEALPPGIDRDRLATTLAACGGNKTRAARALSCSRMTLYRKLKKHSLIQARYGSPG